MKLMIFNKPNTILNMMERKDYALAIKMGWLVLIVERNFSRSIISKQNDISNAIINGKSKHFPKG